MSFKSELGNQVLILDGAMGTMLQSYGLNEEDFRGERFADHPCDLKGNHDILCLTQPKIVEDIHDAYFKAGADLVETNTFNATAISQADYQTQDIVYEINLNAARIARNVAERFMNKNPKIPRFVCGALGPTNKTASISPDVNSPEYRNTDFDILADAYLEQCRGLLDGGVDIFLIETVFDTLNCKAALFAIQELFSERGISPIPVMVSGTITDASGRTLSGQTVEAFWHSIRHVDLLAVGLNCALGAEQIRPWLDELSAVANVNTFVYPNAGFPNEFGDYEPVKTTQFESQIIF